MPFDEGHLEYVAKEVDGSDSIYCSFCYQDGQFLESEATVSDRVELGVPHLVLCQFYFGASSLRAPGRG